MHSSSLAAVEALLPLLPPATATVLERATAAADLTVDEIAGLFELTGVGYTALTLVGDHLRAMQCGDDATYVVNRNINFTNACIKRCGFCAFSRTHREDEAYFLPTEEILRRVAEAVALGATEVCVQAGLAPKLPGNHYIDLTRAIKAAHPQIHLHAFSPEEVLYGAVRSRRSIRDYVLELKDAGIGSLPGTSAEILVQSVRDRIAQGRITAAQWEDVIVTAHLEGIRTTATIMFGHLESYRERALHLATIRRIQLQTGGFTEFVPLSFVHTEAPMFSDGRGAGMRPGPDGLDVVRMHAISRIVLGRHLKNIQASWVKEGARMSQTLLGAGANDVGGTLINESISTSAGAAHGQFMRPHELQSLIRGAGRTPHERTTLYGRAAERAGAHPLDTVDDAQVARFGTFHGLIASDAFRFVPFVEPAGIGA